MQNPIYNMYGPQQGIVAQQFSNPMQKMQAMMEAMKNPSEFIRRLIPNIPPEISNDPNLVAQYLLQNGYCSPYDYQQAVNQTPPGYMR